MQGLDNDTLKQLEENLKISTMLSSGNTFDIDDEETDAELADIESQLGTGSKTSKKKEKKASTSKATMYKKEPVKKNTNELPSWHLGTLGRSEDIEVFVPYHEIPYKGQRWPVRERNMIYKVQLVTMQKENIDCFSALHNEVEKYKDKLRTGLIRYYKVVTYEAIPSNQKELGLVEIIEDGRYRIQLKDNLVAEMRIDNRKLESDIKKAMGKLIKIRRDNK